MSQKRIRSIAVPAPNSPLVRPKPTNRAQEEALGWIEQIIVPTLVENFIRLRSSGNEQADE
jgi:hypothetical protein